MTKQIILIRHGQTDWNLAGRYQGRADIALNATGRAQAQRLAARMKSEEVGAVYSSALCRAAEFAGIVFAERAICREPDLGEICFGVFEGLAYDEIIDKHPEIYSQWAASPFGVSIPGGESLPDFETRVGNVFKKIIARERADRIAIVTHGGVINTIIGKTLKLRNGRDIIPDLASLSVIEFSENKAEIIILNDTEHLKDG